MKYFFYPLFFMLMMAAVSCSNHPQNNNNTASDTSAQKQAIDTADTRLAKDFSVFITTQIQTSKLAETKSSNQKVKDFALKTVELYNRLNNRLNNISIEYQIKLPAELTSTAKSQIQDLKDIKSSSFDHDYLLQMLKQHNVMIREFNAARNINCVPLKVFSVSYQSDIIKHAYATSDLKDQTP